MSVWDWTQNISIRELCAFAMRSKLFISVMLVCLVTLVVLSSHIFLDTRTPEFASGTVPDVFVSILPQKYFVERIAGDTVRVSVMVQPGHSPATYEPTPKQMADLSNAVVYFSIGVPFEAIWLDRIQAVCTDVLVVDTRCGIELRDIDARHHHDEEENPGSHLESKDPHTWLNPELVKLQAKTICDALSQLEPSYEDFYRRNLQEFTAELSELSDEIRRTLSNLPTREFMVFHPSWGYFADEYGLRQIPIEIDGKEPTAKELAGIIELAKEKNIQVIFVQSQFSTSTADRVAETIGGQVISIDPLAEDYVSNLRSIVDCLEKELR